ncbi:hypothetical protein, partial [Enterobacter hormaechei]|uniref:hypothetical protein n=1 Tax=Enterobacter hormaechei TaxID=158836 RepID=UPI001D00840D
LCLCVVCVKMISRDSSLVVVFVFFCEQEAGFGLPRSLVGSGMCIRDSFYTSPNAISVDAVPAPLSTFAVQVPETTFV